MASNAPTSSEPTMTTLVTGIINDTRELINQEVTLLKHDLRNEVRQTKEAAASLVLGGIVTAIGTILLCLMLVHLLNWLVPSLPVWVCYLIIGGLLLVLGVPSMLVGKKKFETLTPLPEQSVQAIKETVQWTTRPHTFESR